MSWPSPHVWRRIARPVEILDDARVSLGTVLGVLRGNAERELDGGAALYDATVIVPRYELEAAGIAGLRRFMHVRDPMDGSLFSVASARTAVMRGSAVEKAQLEGLKQ
jgi:hypothetical protein